MKKNPCRCPMADASQRSWRRSCPGRPPLLAATVLARPLLRDAVLSFFVGCLAVAVPLRAGTWAPGIQIDGAFDDWDGQVPALVTDPSGDGGSGRDLKAVYLANDGQYLYVRIESYNADAYDGNEHSFIDGDNNLSTGFDSPFGQSLGSDTLIAGASVYGQKAPSTYNAGAGSPSSILLQPSVASMNIEFRVPLATTIPGDIAQSFPGGLGSTIRFLVGDTNGGAGDYVSAAPYTLATTQPALATTTLENFDAFDSASAAAIRSRDLSDSGCTASRASLTVASGNYALVTTHTLGTTPWSVSLVARRFAQPRSIAGHTKITLDVYGAPSATDKNLWVGLVDLDGTYFATTVAFPTVAQWTTVDLGPTSAWIQQAAGSDGTLDLANIVEWRIGVQNTSTQAGGTIVAAYDNLSAPAEASQNLSFVEATGNVPNPERGVYRWGGDITDPNIPYATWASQGYRLVYNQIRLDSYTSSTIPQSYLDSIAAGFARVRTAGMKSMVRIVYNDSGGTATTPPLEASPTYLQTHLAQLQPVLEANKDVIAYFFAGIIGAWGEWHSTYYYRDPSQPYQQYNVPSPTWRRQVMDWLLQYLPSDRFVLIRRPWWKDPSYGTDALYPGQQVSEETAFTTAPVARIGHHNDAFLASSDDWGTYDSANVAANKAFLAGDTLYVPIGGETANYNSTLHTCANVLNELQTLHWTFLHEDYYPDTVNALKSAGCWDTIAAKLGYRLVLTTATVPLVIKDQVPFNLAFTVENRGWAPPYESRPVYLVVLDASTGDAVTSTVLSGVDIRRWKPGQSQTVSLSVSVSLPSPPSGMGLALWLPDTSPGLAPRPEYSLRFANDAVWDSVRGWNVLVSGGISVPVRLSRLQCE